MILKFLLPVSDKQRQMPIKRELVCCGHHLLPYLNSSPPTDVLKRGSGLPHLRIHPYQLQQFVDFEVSLQKNERCDGIPLGYVERAQEFNQFCMGQKQAVCFTEWDTSTNQWKDLLLHPIPPSSLLLTFVNPCYNSLKIFGLLNDDGNINDCTFSMMHATLFHPFAQMVSKEWATKHCIEEMAAKRHHQEESSFVLVTPAELSITSDSRPSKKLCKSKQRAQQTGDGPHIPPVTSKNPKSSSSTSSNLSSSSTTPVTEPSTGGPIPGPDSFYDIADGDYVMAAEGSSA